ncbi:MAG: porin family protein [Bacteroidales bacterium]
MMKKIMVTALAVLIAFPVFSQIKFGIKAGLSTTNVKMSDVKTVFTGTNQYLVSALKEANYGYHAGAFVRFSLLGFYLQPELLFASRTDEYKVVDVATSVENFRRQKFNRLDIPVMVGVHLGPVRINAGPSARLLINSPSELVTDPDLKSRYNSLTFGYQAGLGVDILKLITLDLRYEGSLQKYQTNIENLTGTSFKLDDRPNAFLLSVGILF